MDTFFKRWPWMYRVLEARAVKFSSRVSVKCSVVRTGERKWVERNGSNRPPVPWVESSPFRNWVEWTWVDLEKCQVQGRQHIDFDPSPFDPIRPQSIRPELFDQKGRPNSFRPISFDPLHAIRSHDDQRAGRVLKQRLSKALQIGNAVCLLYI